MKAKQKTRSWGTSHSLGHPGPQVNRESSSSRTHRDRMAQRWHRSWHWGADSGHSCSSVLILSVAILRPGAWHQGRDDLAMLKPAPSYAASQAQLKPICL